MCNRGFRGLVPTFGEFAEMSEWLGQRYEDILMQSPGNLGTWSEMLVPPPGGRVL